MPPVAVPARTHVAPALLAWYDRHRRVLPWRSAPDQASDPYAVWLSEIMLQQTTVTAVKPYFTAFLAAWPRIEDLAAAPLDDVLKAWAGLGYYSRARNLHACARAVMANHGGRFPSHEADLRALPGIGAYTAAAIAAIAFGRRAVVVDGNVERVMARLFAIETPLPQAKPSLYAAMDAVTPAARTGDFAQAVMDLGATICTPRGPACVVCPLMDVCDARRSGRQQELPKKLKKAKVPHRAGAIFFIRHDDRVLVRQRPAEGLFGGMTEFPSTPWTGDFDPDVRPTLPIGLESAAETLVRLGRVEHGLTHFELTLHVYVADLSQSTALETTDGRWVPLRSLEQEALPTVMRKVLRHVLETQRDRDRIPLQEGLGVDGSEQTSAEAGIKHHPRPEPRQDASRRRHRPRKGSPRTLPLR